MEFYRIFYLTQPITKLHLLIGFLTGGGDSPNLIFPKVPQSSLGILRVSFFPLKNPTTYPLLRLGTCGIYLLVNGFQLAPFPARFDEMERLSVGAVPRGCSWRDKEISLLILSGKTHLNTVRNL